MVSNSPASKSIRPAIASVAVPIPLRQCFDFLVPSVRGVEDPLPVVGGRVLVPFGSRKIVGIVTELKSSSSYPEKRLKPIIQVLDREPLFEADLWSTLEWLSRYYLAPIGEVFELALPITLRKAANSIPSGKKVWRLSESGRSRAIDELKRAPLQLAIIKRFMQVDSLSSEDFKQQSSGWRQAVNALLSKDWLEQETAIPRPNQEFKRQQAVSLNHEQQTAAAALAGLIEAQSFSSSLLQGVTGSGKTEVYFSAMRQVIKAGKQVLLLVPEIGLTPQLVQRVENQLCCPIAVMHSGLSDGERHLAWWYARTGDAKVVIGTRSAVFATFSALGLIVVDEEHDASFKQQEGVRYQARDVAIYRAKQADVPIVLGSATPSLESYAHAKSGRYQYLRLQKRATAAPLPDIALLDLNRQAASEGLCPALVDSIQSTLETNKQVMLFLNRRGYAPVIYCADCGEGAKCHRCDSYLTLHKQANHLRCHHCGYQGRVEQNCRNCASENLVEVGEGTQRIEDVLSVRFPEASVLRIDRDSTRNKGELQKLLEQARSGQADILLGTQLLSKGHDFPHVAMVGILNADSGLYSTDFRASESLFQQIVQVAGRAGRRAQTGQVLIQTHFPNHPFFRWVSGHDFDGFAEQLLEQRQQFSHPPFGYFALLRAESIHQSKGLQFLRRAKSDIPVAEGIQIMDAIAAPMERRAGRYRAQLLICATRRSVLNSALSHWLNNLKQDSGARKLASAVRWSLDVDPLDHY